MYKLCRNWYFPFWPRPVYHGGCSHDDASGLPSIRHHQRAPLPWHHLTSVAVASPCRMASVSSPDLPTTDAVDAGNRASSPFFTNAPFRLAALPPPKAGVVPPSLSDAPTVDSKPSTIPPPNDRTGDAIAFPQPLPFTASTSLSGYMLGPLTFWFAAQG